MLVKIDGFVLPDVIAMASVVSMLLGRSGIAPGSTRTVIGLVTPSTVIAGQTCVRRHQAGDGLVVGADLDPGRIAERGVGRAGDLDGEAWRCSAASPSETVSVSDAVPGAAQVKVGFCAVALLSVPRSSSSCTRAPAARRPDRGRS